MAKALVLPHKRVRGFTGTNADDITKHPVMSFREAMETRFDTDAHFCPYVVRLADGTIPDEMPRCNTSSLSALREQGCEIEFHALVIDVDDPVAHEHNRRHPENKIDARDDWRGDQLDLVDELPGDLLEGLGRYDTRGGYRLVWELPEPLPAVEYLQTVAALRGELRANGIEADELKDWTRLYRLPRVNRDGMAEDRELELSLLGPIGWKPDLTEAENPFAGIGETRGRYEVPDQIEENRNVELTRMAGGLRRRGLTEREILEMITVVNSARCNPPLPTDELEQIAKSVCRYDPEPTPTGDDGDGDAPAPAGVGGNGPRFSLGDEVEIARAVLDDMEYTAGPGLVYDRSKLWQYREQRGIWETVFDDTVHRIVHGYSGEQIMRGVDRNGNPRLVPLKISHRFCQGVQAVVGHQRRRREFFDEARDGIVFGDVFVQVNRDGVHTEAFSPNHRQTTALPFAFQPGARPAKFLDMLKGCFRDDDDCDQKIQLLREWIGAALCNKGTTYQQGLIFVGHGANGKSTVQECIQALFPTGSVTAIPPQDMDNEYRRAKLANARLNLVSELPEADILVSEPVKALISGDLMSARFIREDVFEFRPRASHCFSANALPGVRDMSAGFWRRWIVVEWNREFKPSEQDRSLAADIISTELPALASWAIEGAADVAARGHYALPMSAVRALNQWRRNADQVASFCDEMVEDLEEGKKPVAANKLYNAYSQWALRNGHKRLSRVNFGKRVRSSGIEKRRTSAGMVYEIQLRRELTAVV